MKAIKLIFPILSIALLVGFYGCKKKSKELPGIETPVIEMTKIDDNTYSFRNATPGGGYVSHWDFGGTKTSTNYTETVFFPIKGQYTITLTSNSKGGISTASTTVDISVTSPYGATPKITQIDERRYRVEDITIDGTNTKWDFGNGVFSTKKIDTAYYPFSGTRTLALTSTSVKGTSTNKLTTIKTDSDDPNYALCKDEVLNLLTGGCTALNGKTWVFDPSPKKSNVGSASDASSSYYNYPDGLTGSTWTDGALNNEYTFKLRDFVYAPKNNNATIHFDVANKFFGKHQDKYADIALQDPKHAPATFILNHDATNLGTGYGFTLTNGSYIGYNENRFKYYIVRINADTMYISHNYNGDENTTEDPALDKNARSFTLVAKK